MSIYIHKNDRQSGPFEENSVLTWLKNGQLSPEDLAWRAGANSWQPLKSLFSTPASTAAVSIVPTASGNSDQSVVDWARQNLSSGVEIKLKFNSLFGKIILFSVFFFSPGLLFIFAISKVLMQGFSDQAVQLLGFAVIISIPFILIYSLIWVRRKKIARFLDADGAETLNGEKYLWENLSFINYKKFRKPNYFGLIGILIQAIFSRDPHHTVVELVFDNGKAVIPPQVYNQAKLLSLLEKMPAERQDEE